MSYEQRREMVATILKCPVEDVKSVFVWDGGDQVTVLLSNGESVRLAGRFK